MDCPIALPQGISSAGVDMPGATITDITFIANADTGGNGKDISTMDYFFNVQCPWLSLIIPVLRERNFSVEVACWEDLHVDWRTKKIIVLGPIWGYVAHIHRFMPWLDLFAKQNVMRNSVDFIKWNMHKKYLLDLKNADIPIPKTEIVAMDSEALFEEVIIEAESKFGNGDLIIKGAIDAGAFGFRYLKQASALENSIHFEKLKSANFGVVIQPFLPEIHAKGEVSIVYFANKFSHMFLRVTAPNEVRVQSFYGGRSYHFNKFSIDAVLTEIRSSFRPDLTITTCDIHAARKQAKGIYDKLLGVLHARQIADPLYVRIDGVMVQGVFTVMEIEGIEPYMEIKPAMQHDPSNDILGRYADAILAEIALKPT